jgi:DNA-binding response OmpR family regulator
MATALVVEDDDPIAELVESVLTEEGLTVVRSRTGHEAMQASERFRPDIVLLDLGLPGVYGTSIASALKARWRDLPILVVSALSDETVARDAAECGAAAYLTKPFELEQLTEAVRRLLATSLAT